jgi:ankyrin repeat protein
MLLLNKSANANAQGRVYSSSLLYAALDRGYKVVVKLLLNKGANVNTQGREYSNAL